MDYSLPVPGCIGYIPMGHIGKRVTDEPQIDAVFWDIGGVMARTAGFGTAWRN